MGEIFDHFECHWFNVNVDITPAYVKTCYLEKIIYKKESVVFYRSHDYGILQHTFEVKLLHIKHKGLWICFVKTSPLCLYVTVFITQIIHLVTMKISLLTLPRVFCKLHIFIKLELGKEFYDWCLGFDVELEFVNTWYDITGGPFFRSRNLQGCLSVAAQSDLVTVAPLSMHYLLEVGKIILCVGRNHICWWIDN